MLGMEPARRLTLRSAPRRTVPAIFGLAVLLALVAGCVSRKSDEPVVKKTALQRVLDSGKIRCGYLIYSPYLRKDPNSGQLSGIFHDVMEEIGRNAGLQIQWTEEVGYENIYPGLDAGRFDVFCPGLWPNASRAKAGYFTVPIFYSFVTVWGRATETRFSSDLSAIDSPSVRIATIDGAMEDIIARTDFPKATRVSLPQLSPFTQNFLNITSGKADITFAEPSLATEYLRSNPGTIKPIAAEKPLRVFGNTLVVRRGENELKEFLDVALLELLHSGRVDRIVSRYEPSPNAFLRVAPPYRFK